MKLKTFSFLFSFCFLLLSTVPSYTAEPKNEPVESQLIVEENSIQPGHPFWVGVELKMADGWDTYWLNPGDSGFATQVDWHLPEGFTAGPLHWPYPEKFINDSLVAFGYTKTVVLLTEITPPKDLSSYQKIDIGADVSWLACNDSCIPGKATLSLSVPVSKESPEKNSATQPLFSQARAALPKAGGDFSDLSIQAQAEEIVLHLKPKAGMAGNIEEMLFIPEQGEMVDYAAPQSLHKGNDEITLNVKRANPAGDMPQHVKGVLLISEKGSDVKQAIQVDTDIAAPAQPTSYEGVSSVAMALGFAFLGGLILNVMPCVLPVIALKIFGFVKMANQNRWTIFKHGGVFSLGVLLSFWVLSGILLVLRSYGEGIGWGFQLQEPVFVVALAGILFTLGLSLFGVFELGTSLISLGNKTASSSKSPMTSSFMSGVLATLVATPCTGPLLGPALGFAMTLPAVKALMIFSMMGLGMAFPYLLFSAFPKLVRFLPKPGNWMITFKQLMGFLMMGTVAWLVWVFGAQTDNMATFVLLAGLLLIAIGTWIFGKWATPLKSKAVRLVATAMTVIFVGLGGGTALFTAKQHREIVSTGVETKVVSDSGWENYSPERIAELRAQGVPVFVDFTAKWCLICQANKVILHSSEVQKAFKEKGVVAMAADWTKKDSVITKELEKLGRSGVPVYVLYPGDLQQKPYILPQTLSGNVVREYLEKLGAQKTTVYAD